MMRSPVSVPVNGGGGGAFEDADVDEVVESVLLQATTNRKKTSARFMGPEYTYPPPIMSLFIRAKSIARPKAITGSRIAR